MNSDFTPNPREEIEARLTALLFGELSAEEAAALQQEIRQDAKLAELHERLKSTVGMVREVAASPTAHSALQPAPLKLSEDRRQRLLAQFKTVTPREFARPKRREVPWVLAMSIAAVLVALVGAVALFPALSVSKRRSMLAFKSASDSDGVSESKSLKSAFTILAPRDSKAEGLEIPRSHTNSFVVMTLTNGVNSATNSFGRGEKVERFMRGKSQADNLAHFAPPPKPAAIALAEGGEVADGKKMALAGNFYLDPVPEMQAMTNGITDEAGVSRRGMERKQGMADQTLGYNAPELPSLSAPAIVPPAPQKRLAIILPDGAEVDDGKKSAHAEDFFFGLTTNYQVARADITYGGGGRSATSSPPSGINGWAYSTGGGGGSGGGAGPAPKPSGGLSVGDPEFVGILDRIDAKHSSSNKYIARYDFIAIPPSEPGAATIDPATGLPVSAGGDATVADGRIGGIDPATGLPVGTRADVDAAAARQEPAWTLELPKDFQTAATNGVSGTYFGSINGVASSTYRRSVPAVDSNTGLPTTASVTPDAGQNLDRQNITPQNSSGRKMDGFNLSDASGVDKTFRFYTDLNKNSSVAEEVPASVASPSVPPPASQPVPGALGVRDYAPGAAVPLQSSSEPAVQQDLITLGPKNVKVGSLETVQLSPNGNDSGGLSDGRIVEKRTRSTLSDSIALPEASDAGLTAGLRAQKPAAAAAASDRAATDGEKLAFGYQDSSNKELALSEFDSDNSRQYRKSKSPNYLASITTNHFVGRVPTDAANSEEARKSEVLRSLQTPIALPSSGTVDLGLDLGVVAHEETLKKGVDRAKKSDSNASVEKLYALQDAVPAEAKEGLGRKVITEHTVKQLKEKDRPVVKPVTSAAEPQAEVLTGENAFSTFSLNVADVSFRLAGASLEKGVMPEPGSVRSEEFVNAFDYRDPAPAPGAPIGFAWERARYPFAQNRDMLRFSVKTAAAGREAGRPLNIVLLLDNSGSMERADRVQIIHEALKVLASQLQPQDKLSVVTFARTPRLWVDGVAGNEAGTVAEQLSNLAPQGGTNLEDAMKLAYETALRHYLANGVNRVVLLTDGAANLGNVDPAALKQMVEAERKQGIALDCFGIGWEGYNDDLLEVLSRNGDGRYGFINTPEEATTGFASQLAGALHVAAADVKVQVEFNPQRVTAYRQIGYAKHQLTKEQFRDNTVDAAELGAAESGNALYAIEVNPSGTGPLATVHVRYKEPGTGEFHEREWAVPYNGDAVSLEQATPAMRLATSASAFSEWLASSPYAADVTPDRLLGFLGGVPEVYGADTRPKKLEWMVRQAKSLSGK